MKAKTYYAKQKSCSVSVPQLDDSGKPIVLRDASGNPKRGYGGRELLSMRNIRFDTISGNPKLGFLSKHTTSDPEEQRILDDKAEDGGSPILDEKTYKKSVNREAYEMEQKAKQLEGDNKVLLDTLDSREKELDALKAKVEKLQNKGK